MTTGDAANTSTSQDLGSLAGKIHRFHLDGSIPEDNPIPGSSIWSWGHRNPQGLVIAPNGIMYSSEHGPSTDDEVNIIEKGRNYGWPEIRGFCDQSGELDFCADSNVFEPIAAWTPTLAVSGADFYASDEITGWNNSVLVTSLKASRLVALRLSKDGRAVMEENQYFTNWFGRLRDLCVSPSGDLYLATSNRDGRGDPRPGDDRIVKISAVKGTTSLDDPVKMERALNIYPNPVTGNTLFIDYTPLKQATVIVYNGSGQEVLSAMIGQGKTVTRITLPETPGLYLIRIRDGEIELGKRVLKQ
jgi:glucose/arabinose dehydrogenase